MRIAIAGASGLVGTALTAALRQSGHEVIALVRDRKKTDGVWWSPKTGEIDTVALEGIDAAINLAGKSIAESRWTAAVKQELRSSRVDGTRCIVQGLGKLKKTPSRFLCASAIGYYGNRGDAVLTEEDTPGTGFFPELSVAWEKEAAAASQFGIHPTRMRLGIVLTPEGGALKQMLLPFRLGLGGRLGAGNQWFSWVSLRDVITAIQTLLNRTAPCDVANIVAPNPVTNRVFTAALAKAVHRPAVIPAPEFLLRLAFGEMADEAMLASLRVVPKRLTQFGFTFADNEIEATLRSQL